MTRTLMLVAGARPNFMKVAPLMKALRQEAPQVQAVLVHTGQHHDHVMSGVFFEELGLAAPDHHLGPVQSAALAGVPRSPSMQTARILLAFDDLLARHRPDMVAVVGDVDSTLACALASKKAGLPVVHIEAGLRSGDLQMPEEINRRATDAVSDWCFASESSAVDHLLQEGHAPQTVFLVGQWMVDTVLAQRQWLSQHPLTDGVGHGFRQRHPRFGVVTLHRAGNVDDLPTLRRLSRGLREVSALLPLAFPVHPRTQQQLAMAGIDLGPRVHLLPPLPYRAFLDLWSSACVVLTDSGGLQEETTALGVACLTLRDATERPATVTCGTNTLVGTDPQRMLGAAQAVLQAPRPAARAPALWDGRASERTVAHLRRLLA